MTSLPFPLHVLVPAYGPSPYLLETLRSVTASADERTIVTVVDDGSPGDEVRAAAAAAGPGVDYVRLEKNLGVAGAFQACTTLSRGEYTVLLGSDDLLEPRYVHEVRRLVQSYASPEMVLPGVTVIGSAGHRTTPLADRVKRAIAPRRERLLQGDRLAASLLIGNWLYFPAISWRTDVLREKSFRQDMQTALDLDLELRIIFDGGRLAWSHVPAFHYRRHDASASSLTALSGDRFDEERCVFSWARTRARELGWRRSALAARVQPTSRLHRAVALASAALSGTRTSPEHVKRRRR